MVKNTHYLHLFFVFANIKTLHNPKGHKIDKNFPIKYFLLLIILIIASGYGLLWFYHNVIPDPLPNKEFYLLILIYSLIYLVVSIAYKNISFIERHRVIGIQSTKIKYFIIAILSALIIWGSALLMQKFLLNINVIEEARDWYLINQNHLPATFVTTVVFAPIVEEMLFRGIFLQTMRRYLSPFLSIFIVSLIFSVVHFSLSNAIPLFVASVVYCIITIKSQSIIPSIIAHIFNNFLTFAYFLRLV